MSAPTRQIIILSTLNGIITYVLRADVPVGQEGAYATPGATSPTGNTGDPDLPHLIDGTIAQVTQQTYLPQANGETQAAYRTRCQTALQGQWGAYQASITASTPRTFFGAFWNGTSWVASGG